jgi:hypothetical protein
MSCKNLAVSRFKSLLVTHFGRTASTHGFASTTGKVGPLLNWTYGGQMRMEVTSPDRIAEAGAIAAQSGEDA